MKISISSSLKENLSKVGYSSAELSSEFYNLISGYQDTSDFFGKDVSNINSVYVRHVHIIPDDTDPKRKNWMSIRKHEQRTSDNLLFYCTIRCEP